MGGHRAIKPLVRCPVCGGELIYPTYCLVHHELGLLERRCPDCEHRDCVRTNRHAAELWLRRHARHAEELAAVADALADGLEPDFAEQRIVP
jgi:hypothetical protein